MISYKEFIIQTEPEINEAVTSLLWTLNISGLVEEDNNTLKVYCKINEVTSEAIQEKLNILIAENLIRSFEIKENEIEEKNWNEEWEKSINVIEVSDKLVIKPSFREYESKPGQIIITIDPKMSFGTGEHQTTKLMLLMIEKYVKPGMKILDVGTGTGVLGIASVKLGAEYALAIDNDEWCYDNGIENCSINSVNQIVEIRTATIDDIVEKDFDIILANINKNILMELAEKIIKKLSANGQIILSGLLLSDEQDIVNCYSNTGFKLTEIQSMDEWITLVMNK